jgi:hypothetical protein
MENAMAFRGTFGSRDIWAAPSIATACAHGSGRQVGNLAASLDHPCDTHAPERLAALIDEHMGRLDAVGSVAMP